MRVQTRGWFLGEGALLVRCAELFLKAGQAAIGITTTDPVVERWAVERHIPVVSPSPDLAELIRKSQADYLFSIGNQTMLSAEVLRAPSQSALNFHYGPLPEYAGVHVPTWSLLNGERRHGVTWHEMTAGVDAGRVAKRADFDVSEDETASSLHVRCFEAGLETFASLINDLVNGGPRFTHQDFSKRAVFRRHDRPPDYGIIDWSLPGNDIERLVRALDFGPLDNEFGVARVLVRGDALIATEIRRSAMASGASAGAVIGIEPDAIVVATGTSPVAIVGLRRLTGEPVSVADVVGERDISVGYVLPGLSPEQASALSSAFAQATRRESEWLERLRDLSPVVVPHASGELVGGDADGDRLRVAIDIPASTLEQLGAPHGTDTGTVIAALAAAFVARIAGASVTIPLTTSGLLPKDDSPGWRLLSECVPLLVDLDQTWLRHLEAFEDGCRAAEKTGSFFVDVCARYPNRPGLGSFDRWRRSVVVCLNDTQTQTQPQPQTSALALIAVRQTSRLIWDASSRIFTAAALERMQDEFRAFVEDLRSSVRRDLQVHVGALSVLTAAERTLLLGTWNETARSFERSSCIHELIEAQAAKTPQATAVVFRDRSLTYAELNARANALAGALHALNAGPGGVVGVFVERSLEMVIALLAIHKSGAAYLPLDPSFPSERLAWMVEDTGARVILTQAHLVSSVPEHQATVIVVDSTASSVDLANPSTGVTPDDLAYVIFTSGSTGRPKGVMVRHRNVTNFFAGMDDSLQFKAAGKWLAVTSISFDISVLELLWTLSRGFTVIVQEELEKAVMGTATEPAVTQRSMAFGLFYFSADARQDGEQRYRLLFEGAKYADSHGFSAVWTPERHFHEFGGLYPNPAVTSAAIAAMTTRVQIRAGSVVLPLHNPIRVAEEWAVVDNISQGRVEMSFASGWHANDFALMPEAYEDRRDIMLRGIETVRRLWRGESSPVTNGRGQPIDVRIYPRPHQKEPAVWIAAAGNVDTFTMAGRIGAKLLTNLLGQSIDDVATKVEAYRASWKAAGHAGDGRVALMLHTFVGSDVESVRATVRKPLIDYLKTSTELVKQARWEFPAFATPGKQQGPLDNSDLSEAEIDAMMEHAFERYFQTSGLFGTPETCLGMVNRLKAAGIDEIACLMDFGIDTDVVLGSLSHLNNLRERSQPVSTNASDYSIPAQIVRHGITHLQGTPSLMRTILADERGSDVLGRLQKLLVGGEPLPTALAGDLVRALTGDLLNMYGPTETTVWSSVAKVTDAADITIGRPVANTQIYLVDRHNRPTPIGTPGELLIGGEGVTPGYWNRPDLTADRFIQNPCSDVTGDVVYRTGDLARYREDGRIEFLGRLDHQVKIHGHRIELGEIEASLDAHPSVAQSVVVVKTDGAGEPRLVAYVVPKDSNSTVTATAWQVVWNDTYRDLSERPPVQDPAFDTSGWRSSYSGDLIPDADMREWVDTTVARILELGPARVLEIGCGTGLLLYRLAPRVEHYTGVDFSPAAIERLRHGIVTTGFTNVDVHESAADAVAALPGVGLVDVVVINSVAQYFPDIDYMIRVLDQALALVRPEGAIFLGDVRTRTLLEAFHLSVELAQAPALMPAHELRQRVSDRVKHDAELVIAPEFFHAVRSRYPSITHVTNQLKRGRAETEMVRFRCDVVLHVGSGGCTLPEVVVSGASLSAPDIVAALARSPEGLCIRGITNPRVVREVDALAMVARDEQASVTVGEVRDVVGQHARGVEPEDVVAAASGWDVELCWADDGRLDRYDAIIRPCQARRQSDADALPTTIRPWGDYVHQAKVDSGQLVQSLRQHLRSSLPPYMVPGAIVTLASLPLTPNGKIDRKALPEPDRQRQESVTTYVAPADELERLIAETWQELLALERVSTSDNFFDIGANSLLMVQAHSALRDKLGRRLSLVDLFRFPTVGTLAAHLGQSDSAAASVVLVASETRAQSRIDALSKRRQGRQVARTATPVVEDEK